MTILVALCGRPQSGKTEVQKILARRFRITPIDDGRPMRDFAINSLGLTEEKVTSQAGKNDHIEIAGQTYQVRDILGTLGVKLEEMFGEFAMPAMAYIRVKELEKSGHPFSAGFSFGSVRRRQGLYYKERGGIVIEIRNPDAKSSKYDFDQYDASLADYVIENDAISRKLPLEQAYWDLEKKVCDIITRKFGIVPDMS